MIGEILGAAASLIGQGINYEQNQDVARQNWANQLTAWNMTNGYNSPAEQMRRFKEAGLNPKLIYGQQNLSQSPAPSLVQPQHSLPYEQLGSLVANSSASLALASREARSWADYLQKKKESDSRIEKNNTIRDLNSIEKDLRFLKFTSFRQGDYFGNLVANLAKRNAILDLKKNIDNNTFDFLNRSLEQRIAAVKLKNDLMQAQKGYYESADEAAWQRSLTESNRRRNLDSSTALNYSKRDINKLNRIWLSDRNRYSLPLWTNTYMQGNAKLGLLSSQRGLYDSRSEYTGLKSDFYPYEFGLDVINKLGRLGLDAWKLSKPTIYKPYHR